MSSDLSHLPRYVLLAKINHSTAKLQNLNFHPLEVVSRYRDPQLQVGENYSYLFKAAPWEDLKFRFLFCNEVVYPTDHDFIFYGIFRFFQIFFIHTFMNPTVTQTNFAYT